METTDDNMMQALINLIGEENIMEKSTTTIILNENGISIEFRDGMIWLCKIMNYKSGQTDDTMEGIIRAIGDEYGLLLCADLCGTWCTLIQKFFYEEVKLDSEYVNGILSNFLRICQLLS